MINLMFDHPYKAPPSIERIAREVRRIFGDDILSAGITVENPSKSLVTVGIDVGKGMAINKLTAASRADTRPLFLSNECWIKISI
jgi:hypothetical protein